MEELQSLLQPAVAMSLLRERVGDIDLSGYPLDGPFPELQGQFGAHEHADRRWSRWRGANT